MCPTCLGPREDRYAKCLACNRLYQAAGIPAEIESRVVPMSLAINPGPWYAALKKYKRGMTEEYLPQVVSVATLWMPAHRTQLTGLLDGEPTGLCCVPSKKTFVFANQPLVRGLQRWPPLDLRTYNFIDFSGERFQDRRYAYFPQDFARGIDDPTGHRILLVEDAWATGATAVSAAACLLELGAAAVAVLPIARLVSDAYWPPLHPYRELISDEYRLPNWPR